MNLRKLISFFAIVLLILPISVCALQQTVDKIILNVEVGGSNSSSYGLINDENVTLTVKLRTEGNISDFVQIPTTLELPPKKFVPVYVNATIPKDYDFSKGRNITGYVYALLEGQPGQVQINVQARKTVIINVLGGEQNVLPEIKIPETKIENLPISGFATFVSNPFVSFAIGLVVALLVVFLILKRKGGEKILEKRYRPS